MHLDFCSQSVGNIAWSGLPALPFIYAFLDHLGFVLKGSKTKILTNAQIDKNFHVYDKKLTN